MNAAAEAKIIEDQALADETVYSEEATRG